MGLGRGALGCCGSFGELWDAVDPLGSSGLLWVLWGVLGCCGSIVSVLITPDSGSKGLPFVAEHSAVQELVPTQVPMVLSQANTCPWLPTSAGGLVSSRKG